MKGRLDLVESLAGVEAKAIVEGFTEVVNISLLPGYKEYKKRLDEKRAKGSLKWIPARFSFAGVEYYPVCCEDLDDHLKPYERGFVRLRKEPKKTSVIAGGVIDESWIEEHNGMPVPKRVTPINSPRYFNYPCEIKADVELVSTLIEGSKLAHFRSFTPIGVLIDVLVKLLRRF